MKLVLDTETALITSALRRVRAAAPLKPDGLDLELRRLGALRRVRAAAPLKLFEHWQRVRNHPGSPSRSRGGPIEADRKSVV